MEEKRNRSLVREWEERRKRKEGKRVGEEDRVCVEV